MGQRTAFQPGEFCWIDLMAHDRAAAADFYTRLFADWTAARMEDVDEYGHPYTIFQQSEQNVAGLGELPPEVREQGVPPAWNSYINVDDVDATCALAGELGGQVFMPAMDVPGAGRMAGIQDPTGAMVFLWSAENHHGADVVNGPHQWVWNELITPDPAAAMAFYRDLLGWRFQEDEHQLDSYWMILARPDDQTHMGGGVMRRRPEQDDIPPHWSIYFHTPEIDDTLAQLTSLGGSVHVGPMDLPVGKIAVVQDPQGAWFNVIAMNVEPDE